MSKTDIRCHCGGPAQGAWDDPAELANQMGVTDKAVSKWERDLSFPDAAALPKLAEILGRFRR